MPHPDYLKYLAEQEALKQNGTERNSSIRQKEIQRSELRQKIALASKEFHRRTDARTAALFKWNTYVNEARDLLAQAKSELRDFRQR